jgi:hypothetical protein
MSDPERVALINAAQAVVVAVIGMIGAIVAAHVIRGPQPKGEPRRFRTFVWVVAPLLGGTLCVAALAGWRALGPAWAILVALIGLCGGVVSAIVIRNLTRGSNEPQ